MILFSIAALLFFPLMAAAVVIGTAVVWLGLFVRNLARVTRDGFRLYRDMERAFRAIEGKERQRETAVRFNRFTQGVPLGTFPGAHDRLPHEPGPGCWCQPIEQACCPECAYYAVPLADCWHCHGTGFIEPEEGAPTMLIHRSIHPEPIEFREEV